MEKTCYGASIEGALALPGGWGLGVRGPSLQRGIPSGTLPTALTPLAVMTVK